MSETQNAFEFLCSVLSVEPGHELVLASLAESTTTKEYEAGAYVFFEGELGQKGYYLMSGRIALRKTSPNGKELIVSLLGPGEPFGTIAALDKRPFPLSAQAQTVSVILSFPIQAFSDLLQDNPSTSRALLEVIGARLRASHELSRALAHDKVEVRAAAALLSLRTRFRGQDPNDILLSRQELADAIGITIETATRTMKLFEQEGIVDLTKLGRVRLLIPERLQEIINSAF